QDIQVLLDFYKSERNAGFDAGIELALERILTGPEFLFRVETDPRASAPGMAYKITDIDLASRLSFFLWSSVPDDELLDTAIRGQLSNPDVLEKHVRRMFADPRSSALVANFFGQWLLLRNIKALKPEPSVYPSFDENLREAL